MSIAICCVGCGRSGSVPDAMAGKRVKCPKCATSTLVASAASPANAVGQKRCVDCGIDVSGQKRTKDQSGRYYCASCWSARTARQTARAPQLAAAVGAGVGAADEVLTSDEWAGASTAPEPYAADASDAVCCPACNTAVSPSEMTADDFGDPMCRACYDERNSLFSVAPASIEPVALPPAPVAPPAPARGTAKARPMPSVKRSAVSTGSTIGSGRSGMGQMVIGGLVCLAGTGATIVGYNAASSGSNGGRYTIFSGAIIFGAIGFFRGLFRMSSGN